MVSLVIITNSLVRIVEDFHLNLHPSKEGQTHSRGLCFSQWTTSAQIMKRLNTPLTSLPLQTFQTVPVLRCASFKAIALPVLLAGALLGGAAARAQAPVNQLHFSFTDAPGGTTTTSDTA